MNWVLAAALALGVARTAQAQPVPEQVTMTLDQFLKMYEDTKNRPDKPEGAPLQWALSAARYSGQVLIEDDEPVSALFKTTFGVQNLRPKGDWVRVPLLPGSVAVRSAKLAGVDAPLVLENGWYTLVTDRPGTFDVTVDFAAAVTTDNGSSGFSFDLAGSGATEIELAVPAREDLDFTIDNAKLKSDKTVGATRVVTASLPAWGALSVHWQREIPEAEKQTSRVYAEVHTLVGVGDGLLTAHTTIQDTILFAGINEVQARIPAEMTVLDVKGAGLRDWQVSDDGTLSAQLNFAAEGSYTLIIDLEKVVPVDAATVEVPIVEPLGVERSKGFVGIQALGNLELTPGAVVGAAPVDVRTLPATIVGITDQPVLLGYKYLGSTATVPLSVNQHEEVDVLVTLLDQGEATTMFTQDGRRLTSVRYQVRNNRRQFLRLILPPKAELWSASVAGRAVQPAKSGDDTLLVPLVRSQAAGGALAAFGVEVVYVETGEAPNNGRGTFEAELPRADAPTTWVGWTVYAPAKAHIGKKSFEGSLRDVDYLTRPASAAVVYEMPQQNYDMAQSANAQVAAGGLGEGAAPVQVTLPVDGQALFFEKLLALDERLWVSFDYRGLK